MATPTVPRKRSRKQDKQEHFDVDRAIEPEVPPAQPEPDPAPADQPPDHIQPLQVGGFPKLRTAEELYQWLPRIPGWSIGAIDGRIVMSPSGGLPQARGMTALAGLWPWARERGLQVFVGSINVCYRASSAVLRPSGRR
ncbi:hypothetical protein HNP84_004385 [Thermocatellispora tengchongensis]|uniref:Uncharacterized protein n=1 Tax=Thermocatellispora tengchongensis TaxID=1073253 RepID=A0A840P9W9_9ACTN|nr:hypothetical protein [Thermocatellispora tengchongensis]MBB5134651.1 hypothetical protein [Thermocatellispora tengchongensis]